MTETRCWDVPCLVAGAEKAPARLPALPLELVKPAHGTLHWMVDAAAGAELAAHGA
jgi:hypothetical protein